MSATATPTPIDYIDPLWLEYLERQTQIDAAAAEHQRKTAAIAAENHELTAALAGRHHPYSPHANNEKETGV